MSKLKKRSEPRVLQPISNDIVRESGVPREVSGNKVAAKKRGAILKAAMEMFRRHGFKRTSVELIAEEAKVAKPTIYAHFEDKEALFVAVCQLFGDQMMEAAERALAHGSVLDRFTSILAAKFTFYFDVVLRSPHATELLGVTNDLGRETILASDIAYRNFLIEAITQADERREISLGSMKLSADDLADVLLQSGHGAEYGAKTTEDHCANLRRLVALVLR